MSFEGGSFNTLIGPPIRVRVRVRVIESRVRGIIRVRVRPC